MKEQRSRIIEGKLAPEVRSMYASAMQLSPKFTSEFRSFWNLAEDFSFETGDRH
jgi:acetone carboxylase alpha subunit